MRDACGPALSEAVKSRQIALSWISAGADLALDIIPVLRARSAGKPPRSVVSWKYYDAAVRDAYNKRTGRTLRVVDNGPLAAVAQRRLNLMRVVG